MNEQTEDIDILDLLLDAEGLLEEETIGEQILQRLQADVAPLSFQQQRLWFIHQMDSSSASYNVSGGVRLSGCLDVGALESAINDLAVRHESLRTAFSMEGDRPVQRILQPRSSTLVFTTIEDGLAEEVQRQTVEKIVAEESSHRFDLEEGHLYRARLLRLSEREHVLILTMHHIICDGWSIGVLLRDLAVGYQHCLDPKQPLPPDLIIQYADFAEWQQGQSDPENLGQRLGFWSTKLEALPNLELKTDRPRPTVTTPIIGANHPSELEGSVVSGLRRLGESSGASLAMVTMAAFQALLSRYTGQVDFAVGTAYANRNRVELEDLIGFFVNMVVVRADTSDNPRFVDLLARTRDTSLEALSYADVPLEKLVDELRPERHMHRHPLFQVSFVFQNQPERPFELPGLTLEKIGEDTSARFDIELFLTETENGLRVNWVYDTCLFDEPTVCRMAQHYLQLLRAVSAQPETRLQSLPLITQEEVLELENFRSTWQKTYGPGECLHSRFERLAATHPQRTCLLFEDQRISYGELNRRANQLAYSLIDQGVRRGTLVGLYLERSPDLVIGILAILKTGGAYVPVDTSYPEERIRFILEDSGVQIVLTTEALTKDDDGERPDKISRHFIDSESVSEAVTGNPNIQTGLMDTAYVIYTSGSTGTPKGCLVTHQNVVRLMLATEEWFGFSSTDTWTLFHSCAFDFSVWELWGSMLYGGKLVIVPHTTTRTPEAFYDLVCRHRVSVLNQTPSAFRQLSEVDQREDRCGELALRYVIFGGEALDLEILRPWMERHGDQFPTLVNMYGITETTVHVTYRPLGWGDLEAKRGSVIGQPIRDLHLHILDESLRPVPVGVPGEIFVGGAGVTPGYLNRPELTEARFIPDPFSKDPAARIYRTGDLARFLPGFDVHYLGRSDDQVKLRGFRIELGEIQSRLNQHPAVRECIVSFQNRGADDSALLAWAVPDFDVLLSGDAVRNLGSDQKGQWQLTFDESYARDNPTGADAFNTIGWNSSYNGLLIPDNEMREWLDHSLAQIRGLAPSNVLEIGCGTGMLLLNLAGECDSWTGIDFSTTVVTGLKKVVVRKGLQNVTLRQGEANDLDCFADASFDTIVINSVVQYFSDSDYLRNVLDGALRCLSPGGRILVGDLRSLPLLRAFHASVQFHQAHDEMPKGELRQRFQQALLHEEELVINPQYFVELVQEIPEIDEVFLLPRGGTIANELTKFRYDAILTKRGATLSINQSPPCAQIMTALQRDFEVLAWIDADGDAEPVGAVRRRLKKAPEPESGRAAPLLPHAPDTDQTKLLVNNPLRGKFARLLPHRLKTHLKDTLPDYMVPSSILLLGHLPLTPHGKVDRRKLPNPTTRHLSPARQVQAPETAAEKRIVKVLGEVLQIDQVWLDDDFFEIGGHSLLATQFIARIREEFGVDIPLRSLFEYPILRDLLSLVEAAPGTGEVEIRGYERRAGRPIPASFSQRRLWFLEQLHPGKSVYNACQALQLTGSLNEEVVAGAMQAIVDRHEVLRTRFCVIDGEPFQDIAPVFRLDLERIDARAMTGEAIRSLLTERGGQAFNLESGPLFTPILIRTTDEEWVLLIRMHHIITDGWSLGVLVREFNSLYRGLIADVLDELPPLPFQYGDFSIWQRERIKSAGFSDQRERLLETLRDPPVASTLPPTKIRPAESKFVGARITHVLPVELTQSLAALGRGSSGTLFMTLLAGYGVALNRYNGQRDIVVGSPVANRNHPGLEYLIGFFLNTLALRIRVDPNHSFDSLLEQVREVTLEAYSTQEIPFEILVDSLGVERRQNQHPLFQTLLTFQNFPAPDPDFPGVKVAAYPLKNEAAKCDLSLLVTEETDGLIITAEYDLDLYEEGHIVQFLHHLEAILKAAVADPQQQIRVLGVGASVGEQMALQVGPAFPDADHSQDWLMHSAFESHVNRDPGRIALEQGEQRISYGELDRRSNQLAVYLRQRGIVAEQTVAVCMRPCPEAIIAMLGILKSGAVYLPLDPENPRERLLHIVSESAVQLILTKHTSENSCRSLGTTISAWEDLAGDLDKLSDARKPCPALPLNLAYLIYTSGSTGLPKGVMVPHKGASNLAKTESHHYYVHECSRIMLVASLAFDASISEILNALSNGATLVIPQEERIYPGPDLHRQLNEQQITCVTLRPSLLASLPAIALPSMESMIVAGEHFPADLAQRWKPLVKRLFNAYGPTEATVCVSRHEFTGGEIHGDSPIGTPFHNTRLYVLDAFLDPVLPGVVGELFLGGVGVTRGYQCQAAVTAEAYLPDPFAEEEGERMYRTGDRVRLQLDGNICFVGRVDGQIKFHGYRIESGEIEAALCTLPGVHGAAVIAEPDGEERLVGYLATNDREPRLLEWRSALAEKLPQYMIPTDLIPIKALPLTINGKLDRDALPKVMSAGIASAPQDFSAVTGGDLIDRIAGHWRALLRVTSIKPDQNFFELGGNSFTAFQLAVRVSDDLGIELTVADIFRRPTIHGQTALLQAASSLPASRSGFMELRSGGDEAPVIFFHQAGGYAFPYAELARLLPTGHPVYGVQALGLDGKSEAISDVRTMASNYVEQILSLDLEGTVFLGGHSFGGVLALEVACQLQAMGQVVGPLVLIDALLPTSDVVDTDKGSDDDLEVLVYVIGEIENLFDHPEAVDRAELASLATDRRLAFAAAAIADLGIASAELATDYLTGLYNVYRANTSAWARYQVQRPYNGSAIIILSEEVAERYPVDPGVVWRPVITGDIQVKNLPGQHLTLLKAPYVLETAQAVADCLDTSDPDQLSSAP